MLGFRFVDTDEEVMRVAGGRSIPRIFEEEGESRFRELETGVLESLAEERGLVVSTGGGLPLSGENRRLMSSMGFVVWLDATREAILQRVSGNANRPLLRGDDVEEKVDRMLGERRAIYDAAADLRVETNGLAVGDVAYGVAESVRVHVAAQAEE